MNLWLLAVVNLKQWSADHINAFRSGVLNSSILVISLTLDIQCFDLLFCRLVL